MMSPPMSARSYVSVSGLEGREWKMLEWLNFIVKLVVCIYIFSFLNSDSP